MNISSDGLAACPRCLTPSTSVNGEWRLLPRLGLAFDFYYCPTCGHRFTHARPMSRAEITDERRRAARFAQSEFAFCGYGGPEEDEPPEAEPESETEIDDLLAEFIPGVDGSRQEFS